MVEATRNTNGSDDGAPPDEELMVLAMILIAGADGRFEENELSSIAGVIDLVPDFEGRDPDDLIDKAIALANGYDSAMDAVEALSGLRTEAARKKCYLLAADVALSTRHVHELENTLLEAMQQILGIDDGLAVRIMEVLAIKYAV